MEVHHHPHVEKKGFKEYLLEAFMIFVAVTMGFFAESLRENLYNREREKEYISSLIDNLEQDEKTLVRTISDNEKKVDGLDSLLSLTYQDLANPVTRQLLYTYCQKYVSYYSGFSSNDATMMQLKNSGGLHFIRDHYIADSIAAYDVIVRNVYAAEATYGKAIDNAIDAMSELLILKNGYNTTSSAKGDDTRNTIFLLTNDQKTVGVFFNRVFIEHEWTRNYVKNLRDILPRTRRLIALLKDKY
jgi:hypothetical protein